MSQTKKFRSKSKANKRKQYLRSFVFLVFLAFIIVISYNLSYTYFKNKDSKKAPESIADHYSNSREPTTTTTTTTTTKETAKLAKISPEIKKIVQNSPGTYGVYVYDLETGEDFGINEDMEFYAASTTKIPVLMTLYKEIEEGNIKKTDKMTYKKGDYESGTGSIQHSKVGSVWTVDQLATKLIKQSDNIAKNMLYRLLTRKKIQKHINSFGSEKVDVSLNNQATPYDMSILLKAIYEGEVVGDKLTGEMLDLMTDTEFETRLPRYLDGVRVAHKIGSWPGAISDVGIIYASDHPFVISVYTKNIPNHANAEETIGRIAKEVYDFQIKR